MDNFLWCSRNGLLKILDSLFFGRWWKLAIKPLCDASKDWIQGCHFKVPAGENKPAEVAIRVERDSLFGLRFHNLGIFHLRFVIHEVGHLPIGDGETNVSIRFVGGFLDGSPRVFKG